MRARFYSARDPPTERFRRRHFDASRGQGQQKGCTALTTTTALEELLARDELLDDHAGDADHGEAAVVELLRLHLLELGGRLGLEAERVEAEVAVLVVRADRPVNIVGTNSINACMEAAAKAGGPIMVTFSRGGGQFIAGKAANNDNDAAAIAGAIAGAKHVREVAALYGVPVILHTDHCCKVWLPWFDGLIKANEGILRC